MQKTLLYIHIGTWKTGSSTIQYNLNKYRPELEKEGFVYLSKENKMVTDDGIIRNFREVDPAYVAGSREKFGRILDEKRKKNKDFVFISSAEEFSGDPFDGFKNAAAVAQTIREITAGFALDVKIVVYLRRQDDFIESLYTQSIHLGASHSFEEFLKPFDGTSFNWQFLVDAYAQIFGRENIIIRRYHKKFLPEANSLIQDFGSVISSDFLQNFTKTSSRNRGLSRDALEITRYTNPHLDDQARYQLRNIFQQVNSKQPFEKYSFFTPEQRHEFLLMYGESNAAVAREYLHNASGKLFPDPVDGEHKSYAGLSQEAFAVNLSKAILAVNQRMLNQKQELRNECRNMFLRNRIKRKVGSALNRAPAVKKNLRKLKALFT